MKIDFEEYLMEKHAEDYIGTKDTMVDDFPRWLEELEIDMFINYGNEYANKVAIRTMGGYKR